MKKNINWEGGGGGGDTAHILSRGEQSGWGHRKTLKEQGRWTTVSVNYQVQLTAGWLVQ